ncbi:hypothetical protein [Halorientalis marina]|uniref:hypothetical protein n=1 Tax=Halorientalis marina TaxID=2931976 RepID=UPI001FF13C45|nr:hypothetical protein [Halorientalis marina]
MTKAPIWAEAGDLLAERLEDVVADRLQRTLVTNLLDDRAVDLVAVGPGTGGHELFERTLLAAGCIDLERHTLTRPEDKNSRRVEQDRSLTNKLPGQVDILVMLVSLGWF